MSRPGPATIEENLERIATALEGINQRYAGELAEPETEPETEPEEKPEEPDKPPARARKPTSRSQTQGKVTQEQVREKLGALVDKLDKAEDGTGRDAVMGLLAEHGDGAANMTALKSKFYKAVYDAALDMMDG